MKSAGCHYCGVVATLYFMDAGEMLKRHRHGVNHSTKVITGAAEVDIFREDGTIVSTMMIPETNLIDLPANIDHEIEATLDGTILLNMISVPDQMPDTSYDPHGNGGVLLDDGTIVYP